MKLCPVCKKSKALEEFYKRDRTKERLRSECKDCVLLARKKYDKENTDKKSEWIRIDRKRNPKRYLLRSAKSRAKKQGLPFSIGYSDVIIPEFCPVFGEPLVQNSGKTGPWSMTIDQVVAGKGYTPDNVQVISLKANTMKSDASWEQLIKFSNWILKSNKGE